MVHAQRQGAAPDLGGLWPVDRLLLAALAALSAVAALRHPHPAPFLVFYAALALVTWAAARLGQGSRTAEAVHAFAPLLVIVGVYESVGYLVADVNPRRWDAVFAALDLRLFGSLVALWRGALGRPPWLSDLLSLLYVSYYPLPLAMGVALWAAGRRREYARFNFAIVLAFLTSYVGYFLFPTAGPRVPPALAQAVLGGGPVSRAVRAFIHGAELNVLDAFPSGHTAVSLVFLAYGWRLLPRWRAPLALAVAGIVVSTVYLSHHYVVDVVAGAALAAAVLAVVAPAERALRRPLLGPWLRAGDTQAS